MVIGSDTQRVAIYENGDVIFVKKVNDRLVYHHVTLDTNELEVNNDDLHSRVEREDDGRWLAEVIELPGVLAYGGSENEAIAKSPGVGVACLG